MIDTVVTWIDDWGERHSRPRRQGALAIPLLLPSLIIIGVFGVFPLFYAVYLSLFGGKAGQGGFVGLGNYQAALARPEFWNSVKVTIYYAAGVVPLTLLLSLTVAYGLWRITWGRGVLRTLFFLPFITSAVAAATIWRAVLDPQTGAANRVLELFGLPPQAWLLEPDGLIHILSGGLVPPEVGPSLALCCIIAFDVWHASGFAIVVLLGGLSALPREVEEAARIDGAGGWQLLWRIVLPLLSPALFFLSIVSVIRAFQAFNSFYTLTAGGARTMGTTENLILHVYSNFYEYQYWGYGAAVAVLLSAIIVVLTGVQWRFLGRRVYYT
ncbi:MAG: sugar ABC transporter permease [Candidatus Hydrogenedentes bacterium]|nr:sugar ABC transporter permease [Candidatus Hydrogenedentota bacterium]